MIYRKHAAVQRFVQLMDQDTSQLLNRSYFSLKPPKMVILLSIYKLQRHLEIIFAFDRIKYKRIWPRYVADMQLKTKHPATWKELELGNTCHQE
jgi:hypothetical protein